MAATAEGAQHGEPSIAVAGATGYIGGKLVAELIRRGRRVRAVARRPGGAADLKALGAEVVRADVSDRASLDAALTGIETAYYLVHSMGRGAASSGFADRDKVGARNFAAAARQAGVGRIIYLGGLGGLGSEHLQSRHDTAMALIDSEVPVTYFRAAAVIGAGSESFLTVYYLVKRLPAMVTPRWVTTATQPIAIADVIRYLADAPVVPASAGREIEIGGPSVTTYGGMMDAMARAMGKRPRPRIAVPLLSPGLSSRWIGLVTPVDADVAKPLIHGLEAETIVSDPSGMEQFDFAPIGLSDALTAALDELAG